MLKPVYMSHIVAYTIPRRDLPPTKDACKMHVQGSTLQSGHGAALSSHESILRQWGPFQM